MASRPRDVAWAAPGETISRHAARQGSLCAGGIRSSSRALFSLFLHVLRILAAFLGGRLLCLTGFAFLLRGLAQCAPALFQGHPLVMDGGQISLDGSPGRIDF